MLTSGNKNKEFICARRLYSQYYTRNDISNILVEKLGLLSDVRKVIDLSMGEGALLQAIKDIYPSALLYGCDIDTSNVEKVSKNKLLSAKTFHVDSTTSDIDKIIADRDFDLVIGNPPFGYTDKTPFIIEILEEFSCNCSSQKISLELLFLLIGIRLLKPNGILSYIVPDGLLTNKRYEAFREFLLTNYKVTSVIHLGDKRFEGTEACTHILTIQKKILKTPYKIKLESIDYPSNFLLVSKSKFIARADYSFHTKATRLNAIRLKELDVKIIRGRLSKKQLSQMNVDFIHTTSFMNDYRDFSNLGEISESDIAKEGDIILARVGTRVIGKLGFISRGSFQVSDCIIVIRANNKEIRESILMTLKSAFGKSWLQSISKGVGARHITINDLKELPVSI